MTKIRVYELAKELNMSSKELLEKIEGLDLDLNSHMSSIGKEEGKLIKELLTEDKKDVKSEDDLEDDSHMEGVNKKLIKDELIEDEEILEDEIEEEIDERDIIEVEDEVMVKTLADTMGVKATEVITKLIGMGVMASQNQNIDFEAAIILGAEFGKKVIHKEVEEDMEQFDLDYEDDPKDLKQRPPIVTVMGHVDHGKTSLLDAIRETRVTTGEAGGITQHIGAYGVNVSGKKVVFLDTPGHEAFTSMRARGAKVTDIAILVVAADDGIMPQTVEAISHAKAAHVPIIVAINKIDKPEANVDKIKQELTEYGLVSEDWGGDTITVPVSAKNRVGIEDLLEMILLVAEMQELKANPNRKAIGTIIEAELDKGMGPIATVLVQKGTLRVGDMVVTGTASGRVRAMIDNFGKRVKVATPSVPVVILGLSEVPNSGELLYVVADERTARNYASDMKNVLRRQNLKSNAPVSLEDLFEKIKEGEIKDLNIIIKGDVRGSIEALSQSLSKIENEEVKINVIHGGVGGITESDIMLATASNAIVIGFNVRPNLNAIELAKNEKVDIRTYRVIYEAIEDIKSAVKGMLSPKIVEEVLGRAEIRATFRLPTGNSIGGIYVLNGKITRNSTIRLLRDDIVIFEGKVSSLKRFKDDAREVLAGYEAGIGLENYNNIKEGDTLEAYILKEVER